MEDGVQERTRRQGIFATNELVHIERRRMEVFTEDSKLEETVLLSLTGPLELILLTGSP